MSPEPDVFNSKFREVIDLIHSSRYIAARDIWDSIKEYEYIAPVSPDDQKLLDTMVQRSHNLDEALAIADIDSSWTHGITYFGITTHYKLATDGTIRFRLEGLLENLPIFEQCAVLHEIDLFKEWVPFCSDSVMIDKIGNAELLAYVFIKVFGISRDTLVRAYGADCLQEHDSIVVLGESVESWNPGSIRPDERGSMEGLIPKEVPFRQRGWTHERIDIHDLAAIIHVLSPNTAKTIISARVNLHSSLPQTLINFIVKNIAGVGLYLFQQQALKVSKHPKCSHNERIRQNKEFYLNWVYPKLRDYCISKGWEAPSVAAMSISAATSPTHKDSTATETREVVDPVKIVEVPQPEEVLQPSHV